MDWEAPVDAWYVWLGVALASGTIAAVVLGLPMGPPPDAAGVANTIDRTAGSPYEASSTHRTDATAFKTDGKTLSLRNDHGESHASIAYGEIILVNGDDRLENLTYGTAYEEEFDAELDESLNYAHEEFLSRVDDRHTVHTDEWHPITDDIRVQTLVLQIGETITISAQQSDTEHEQYVFELIFEFIGDENTTATIEATGDVGSISPETKTAETEFLEPSDSFNFNFVDGNLGFMIGGSPDYHDPLEIEITLDNDITCYGEFTDRENDVGQITKIPNLCDQLADIEPMAEAMSTVRVDDDAKEIYVTLVSV